MNLPCVFPSLPAVNATLIESVDSVGPIVRGQSRKLKRVQLFSVARLLLPAILLCLSSVHADEDQPAVVAAGPISGHIHPSVCRTVEGTLVVVYKGDDALMCSRSMNDGETWSDPLPIETSAKRPNGIREVEKFEIYPGTADVLPDDRILVTWNYIADDKATDGYYERALLYSLSSDQGRTWSDQKLIGPVDSKHLGAVRHNVLPWSEGRWLLPLRTGPPRLFDPKTGNLTVFPIVWEDRKHHEFQQIARTTKGGLLAMGFELLNSKDEGKTWTSIENFPAVPDKRDNAEGRHLTSLTDGRVLVTWGIGHDNKGLRYNLSSDGGKTWDKDRTVTLLAETSVAARYYSARTVQLDDRHVGTVFMNRDGVHFLKVSLDRLLPAEARGAAVKDIVFKATIDGSDQRYVQVFPPDFDLGKPVNVLIALHGHGSDRWQFVRQDRPECQAVRDVVRGHGMILVSPDYRAKTSWMGPKAEADLIQIIGELKQQCKIRRVFLSGASMGGASSLTFAALHPKLIAGVAAMNGTANHVEYDRFQEAIIESFGGTKSEIPEEYQKRSAELWPDRFTMPVAVTTGGQDKSVPPQSVLRLAEKLKKSGRRVLSIHREAGGHSTTYEDALAAVEFILNEPASELEKQMEVAWEVVWGRFFQKEVGTFMDYLSSYEPGKELAHLPTAEEVGRQFPNPCGYSTGMEDGVILGGAMLSLLCDQYAVTGEAALRERAAQVFEGLRLCATVHGVPGFVARNVCPEDQKSVYINSSRDQYTHAVHGLWKYYRSPLADEETKAEARKILAAVAERMIAFVTPENDYDFCRADGTRCPLGICRMWNVQAHEAARLPMIYAAAWDATGEERYRVLWRKYVEEAVKQSVDVGANIPAYVLLQMQCSLELLHQLEPEDKFKRRIAELMDTLGSLAEKRLFDTLAKMAKKTPDEMQMVGPDWRHVEKWINQNGYRNPQWGAYREIWHLTREAGESALIPLMLDAPVMSAEQTQQLESVILGTDYERNSSCGIIYHLAAYWKGRRHDLF